MRTLVVIFYTSTFFIISIPIYIILMILKLFNSNAATLLSFNIISKACKLGLILSGTKITLLGSDRVPSDTSVLYTFNHRSYFDILICYSTLPYPAGFVAKKNLAKNPFLYIWMKFLHGIFIEREDDRKMLRQISDCIDLINKGYSLVIAPEGTINTEGDIEMYPFKKGAFRIAEKTECPIIPVAINNADKIFEKNFPWIKSTHVIIEYGEPIYLSSYNKNEIKTISSDVQSTIRKTLEKNQQTK